MLQMFAYQILVVFVVAALARWNSPRLALAVGVAALLGVIFAPDVAFASSMAGHSLRHGGGLIYMAISSMLAIGLGMAIDLAPGQVAPPDLSGLTVTPAEVPSIYMSQSFWLAVLAMLAPIISAKFGVQLNTPALASFVVIVLGFVGKHAWTLHTTNATQIAQTEARRDVLQSHIEAQAGRDAGTAANALADGPKK